MNDTTTKRWAGPACKEGPGARLRQTGASWDRDLSGLEPAPAAALLATFFWDRQSNSVQPLRDLGQALA